MQTLNDELEFDFSSSSTDNFAKILEALNISLAVTSYQSAKLIFIRSKNGAINTHFKSFPRPMGIYVDDTRLTLGTLTEVVEYKRADAILKKIKDGLLDDENNLTKKVLEKDIKQEQERKELKAKEIKDVKVSDALYVPRASLVTGMINIHDIAWGDDGLWVVNSTFSCLSTLSPDSSFIARWKPPFITELAPEDRCHLNGMAMLNGKPKYVTTFNKENVKDSWSHKQPHDGTLIDIDTNEILLDGMIMPHSPRVYKDEVYVCESGLGKIWKYNPVTKEKIEVIKLKGFVRGLYFYKGLMFVGLSKVRASDIQNPIPLTKEDETYSGVWIVNLEDNNEVGHIKFSGDVDQIYDIAIMPDSTYPELLEQDSSLIRHIYDFTEVKI